MKHVFVETNFLVDLLRPQVAKAAHDLFDRVGHGVTLHIPWSSVTEARRTLVRVIKEDLGFTDVMMRFAVRRWVPDNTVFEMAEIHKLEALAHADRTTALTSLDASINTAVAQMSRIDPSEAVIARTLQVFSTKNLPPFDEMVLGAVLTKASELYAAGERELFFCELDADLASKHPPLEQEYASCGLRVLRNFDVPADAPP